MFAFDGDNLRAWFVICAKLSQRQTEAALKICEEQHIESVDGLHDLYKDKGQEGLKELFSQLLAVYVAAQPLDCSLHPDRCVLHLRQYILHPVYILYNPGGLRVWGWDDGTSGMLAGRRYGL
jgi:hypothetical protein